ncbi:MAG TPA: hypothetical protein VD969_00965 [Symbiobacteriaceae bacterium]|nr:hypothetical protein [Symbiobacteriaceae bacterium]
MTENHPDRVPGRDEPDPLNIRQNSFQAGSDGLTQPPTKIPTYGDMKYEDGEGPNADFTSRNAGAGLSGTARADAGTTPALFNDPALKKRT